MKCFLSMGVSFVNIWLYLPTCGWAFMHRVDSPSPAPSPLCLKSAVSSSRGEKGETYCSSKKKSWHHMFRNMEKQHKLKSFKNYNNDFSASSLEPMLWQHSQNFCKGWRTVSSQQKCQTHGIKILASYASLCCHPTPNPWFRELHMFTLSFSVPLWSKGQMCQHDLYAGSLFQYASRAKMSWLVPHKTRQLMKERKKEKTHRSFNIPQRWRCQFLLF